jgi:hypothetical protein
MTQKSQKFCAPLTGPFFIGKWDEKNFRPISYLPVSDSG